MSRWRLVPQDYIELLKQRVQELERQNSELIDRLLLGVGATPIQEANQESVQRTEKAVHAVLDELSREEAGSDDAAALEVESEA